MKKFLSVLFFLIIFIQCTNPEVDFPKEDKENKDAKKTAKIILYKTPTLLIYPKDLGPEIFYYFISLARSNGATDSYFLPIPEDKELINEGIKNLNQFHGSAPVLISYRGNPKLYQNLNVDEYNKIILIDPISKIEANKDKNLYIVISDTTQKTTQKVNQPIAKEEKKAEKNNENKEKKLEKNTKKKELTKVEQFAFLERILKKYLKEFPKKLDKTPLIILYPKEIPGGFLYLVQKKLIELGLQQKLIIAMNTQLKKLDQSLTHMTSKTFANTPAVIIGLKIDPAILKNIDLKVIHKILYVDPIKNIKPSEKVKVFIESLSMEMMQKFSKDRVKATIGSQIPNPRKKLKDFNFWAISVIKLILEKNPTITQAKPEQILYFKGKTLQYHQVVLMEKNEEEKEYKEKFKVSAGRKGLFSALIMHANKDFYLDIKEKNEKTGWKLYLKGMFYSFPFYKLLPKEDSIAEIHSLFTPFDFEEIKLPKGFDLPEEIKKLKKPIYHIYINRGSSFKFKILNEKIIVWLPKNTFPIKIGEKEKQIIIKEKTILFSLL